MAAVPLVVADERGLRVAPEALALLNSIVEPVAIVAVAGPYRSGKSFLLNCLSELEAGPEEGSRGSEPGFAVGSTTNACTRGLWLRASPRSSWHWLFILPPSIVWPLVTSNKKWQQLKKSSELTPKGRQNETKIQLKKQCKTSWQTDTIR